MSNSIYTYQDLEAAISRQQVEEFIADTIAWHRSTERFREAAIGADYMAQRNTTITNYRKFLYNAMGQAQLDTYSANYQCASNYYKINITQLVQYVCGNGVQFDKPDTKDKLGGAAFDNKLVRIVTDALSEGAGYALFNDGDIVRFRIKEFVALPDEFSGAYRAGIRFWQLADDKPLCVTLYLENGYVEFIQPSGGKLHTKDGFDINAPKPYIEIISKAPADDTPEIDGENYTGFPVVPCYGNYQRRAEIVGKREHIDCYDLIESGFANNIDEASYMYWIISNAGGMDDIDLAEFKQRLKTLHVAKTDDNTAIDARTAEVPTEARETLLTRLERDIYNDAMALDIQQIVSGNVTATAIRAAYERLNNRADELEYCIIEFIQSLLALIGVEDTPRFTRSRLTNQEEETQMIINAYSAGLLDDQTAITLLPFLTPETAQVVIDRKADEDMSRYDEETGGTEDAE